MSLLLDSLISLGLSSVQAQIFLLCMEHGALPVSRISSMMNIPRSTIHGYAKEMLNMGFLTCTIQYHTSFYQSVSADHIIACLADQKQKLTKQITQVTELKPVFLEMSQNNSFFPKVRYYQGRESLQAVYKKFTNSTDAFGYFDVEVAVQKLGWTVDIFTKTFFYTSESIREIVVDNDSGRLYAQKIKNDIHQVKFIDPVRFRAYFPSDTIFCDGMVYYISYDNNMIVLEINHKDFYQSAKSMFDILWDVMD